jgi:sortase A
MVMGAVLLVGALSLFCYNRMEAAQAEKAVLEVLPQIMERIPEISEEEKLVQMTIPLELLEPEELVMTEVMVDDEAYIGYLSIPGLGLDLPVMAEWDYERLKKAPCRYSGNIREDNLVLMAHNYEKHFGKISELRAGDSIYFSDMDGMVTTYEVVGRDVLAAVSVEEMTSGHFDLTLFTCDYSGKNRVTVYCDRAE